MNKILYPPLIFIGISIPIYVYALIDRSAECIVSVSIWTLLLLFVLWKSNDNFWINRRLPVMCPNNHKTVKIVVDNYNQTGDVYDEENDIYYRYDAKKKQLKKKDASPENIKLVKETIIDLAKDDYFKKSDIKQIIAAKDICVVFYEELSDHLYYVHYVDNKAKEIIVDNAETHDVASLDYDELDECYQHLDELLELIESCEVAYVGTISMENFKSFHGHVVSDTL